MAVEETREQRDLLSESNSEGHGSVRRRFVDTKPVYVDERGALFHRAWRDLHVWCRYCRLLPLLEHRLDSHMFLHFLWKWLQFIANQCLFFIYGVFFFLKILLLCSIFEWNFETVLCWISEWNLVVFYVFEFFIFWVLFYFIFFNLVLWVAATKFKITTD